MTDPGEDNTTVTPSDKVESSDAPSMDSLVFKVCVAAIWSDGVMAASERDHLSHLVDTIGGGDDERDELRRMALHGVNRHAVFDEVDQLDDAQKRHLFDRCIVALTVDRKLRRQEIRFLGALRRRCGVGFWYMRRRVWRLLWRRRVILLMLLVLLSVLAVLQWGSRDQEGIPPVEIPGKLEIVLMPAPGDLAPLDSSALYERVRHSVVTVNVLVNGAHHGNGSGAVVGWDRFGQLYILTNRHVVYHELPSGGDLCYEAQLESGVQLPAALDFYSRQWDLALLVVPGLSGWAEPLAVLPRSKLQVGQQVYAVGSPMGLDHTFTSGLISALRDQHIQTDATVHFGSSGGPLLDARGLLCGVVTTTHSSKDFSFALYADTIVELLAERSAVKGAEVGP
jgi:hypothetical protein